MTRLTPRRPRAAKEETRKWPRRDTPQVLVKTSLKALEERIIERIEKEAAALSFAFHQRFDKLEEILKDGSKRE